MSDELNHTPFGLGAAICNSQAPHNWGFVTSVVYSDCEKLETPHVAMYKVKTPIGERELFIPFGYAQAVPHHGQQLRVEATTQGEDGEPITWAYVRASGEVWCELFGKDGVWRRLEVETDERDILWNVAIELLKEATG